MKKVIKQILTSIVCFSLIMQVTAVTSKAEEEIKRSYGGMPSNRVVESIGDLTQGKKAVVPPQKYDLRNSSGSNYVTEVKNQGKYGTCWAYAALGACESNALRDKDIVTTTDFSELALTYEAFSGKRPVDPLGGLAGDSTLSTEHIYYDSGGNNEIASNTLLSWGGIQSDANVPYSSASSSFSMNSNSVWERNASHLQNVEFVSYSDTTLAKQKIMSKGAAAIGLHMDESADNYRKDTKAYFYSADDNDTNHMVLVVGWDDNYASTNFTESNQPSSDGAWLIRNSWGKDWGDGGYFWVSYEEGSFNDFTFYDVESTNNYKYNYQYDGGVIGSDSYWTSTFPTMANVYTASSDQTLSAIGVATDYPNTQYQIQVYTGITDSSLPSSGVKQFSSELSGTIQCEGFHTLTLGKDIPIKKGEKFAVAVTEKAYVEEVLRGIEVYELDYTYSWFDTTCTAAAKQSMLCRNNIWSDRGLEKNRNFRIKAYTNDSGASARIDLSGAIIQLDKVEYTYDGTGKKPAVSVKYGDVALTENVDYTVEYSNNINVGMGTVMVTGMGKYSGSYAKTFQIIPKPAEDSYTYITLSDNTICITGYVGAETSVTIPNTISGKVVSMIGQKAFSSKYYLQNVVIPSSVTKIEDNAFEYCMALKSVVLPDNLQQLGNDVFFFCKVNKSFTISSANPNFESELGVLYDKGKQKLLNYPIGREDISFTIPSTVTTIEKRAFSYGEKLKYITIPEGVKSIEDYAFYGCSLLKSARLPDSVTTVGSWSFSDCPLLTAVTIPKGLSLIGFRAFGYYFDDNHEFSIVPDFVLSYYLGTEGAIYGKSDNFETKIVGGRGYMSECTVTLSDQQFTYDGDYKEPEVTVKYKLATLEEDTDYTLEYDKNCDVGTANVKITGCGDYYGTVTKCFTISAKSIIGAKVSIPSSQYLYSGSRILPSVIVEKYGDELVLGEDYRLIYSNNSLEGTASIQVKGIGQYQGVIGKTFQIIDATPTLSIVAGVNKATVKWVGKSGGSGYDIYMSQSINANYSLVKTVGAAVRSYIKTSLKNQTYYFKIRPFKMIDDIKVYGKISGVKSVRVKGNGGKASSQKFQSADLAKSQSYYYDMDTDGKKEKIYYSYNLSSDGYQASNLKVTINGKKVMSSKDCDLGATCKILDIDRKDKKLELYVVIFGPSGIVDYATFFQYYKGKVHRVKITRAGNKDFKLGKYGRIEFPKLTYFNGNGKFTIECDSPYGVAKIGCYYVPISFELKGSKIICRQGNYASLSAYSKKYKYKSKKSITVFAKPNKGSKKSFTIGKKSILNILRIYCPGKIDDKLRMENGCYAYIVTKKGKGWIDVGGGYGSEELFYDTPSWG